VYNLNIFLTTGVYVDDDDQLMPPQSKDGLPSMLIASISFTDTYIPVHVHVDLLDMLYV
jgi:hypothetical protein